MHDATTPGEPDRVDQTAAETLTPERIDAVLARFRQWLDALAERGPVSMPEPARVGLAEIAGQFAALKHEVHLQTRAARQQAEQSAAAIAMLQELQDDAEPADDEASVRPLVKALVETRDALALAEREVAQPLPDVPAGWFPFAEPLREVISRDRERLRSLQTGYELSLKRLNRAIEAAGLTAIATVGQPFDPETMEAVGADDTGDAASGTVTSEARRGYFWRERLFRAALVTVRR